MITHFVLYDPCTRMFVRAGRGERLTISLNYAKHFSSKWSANRFRNNMTDGSAFIIKRIEHQ